jgi:hypothetical protein
MKNEIFVNKLILDSIPVNRDLKRWLLARYQKLCSCNGRAYACDVLKEARIVCKAYRADKDRLKKRDYYERKLPFRTSGWTKMLLQQMDSNPLNMLQVLKLYVTDAQPTETVAEAAHRQRLYLEEIERRPKLDVAVLTVGWIDHFAFGERPLTKKRYERESKERNSLFHRFAAGHTYSEYVHYWHTWHSRLCGYKAISEYDALVDIRQRSVIPEMYKDYRFDDDRSFQLLEDYFVLCSWLKPEETPEPWRNPCPLSKEGLEFIRSYVGSHPAAHGNAVGANSTWFPIMPPPLPFTYGGCVGYVHLIPKSGTVVRRAIAVPQRFIQQGLAPCEHELDRILQRMPMDCTHNQGKFNTKIANRVSNPNLYVGSVDLSQATDNFPFYAADYLISRLFAVRSCHTVRKSWNLFKEVARAPWCCNDRVTRWTKGQPLGTLPSFKAFALGHIVTIESLSFALGYGHSPYVILGDDLLFFNKKLRRGYIGLMNHLDVPLSLPKSHEDNLVEFAGMTFVKNFKPVYTPDHTSLKWESLFDYQRASRVSVPWNKIPKRYRDRIRRLVRISLPEGDAERVYALAAYAARCEAFGPEDPRERMNDLLVPVYAHLYAEEDRDLPDPVLTTGIQMVGGHPITLGDYGYANKGGHLLRYRHLKRPLPEWYRDKFRPVSTDKRLQAAALAIKEASVSLATLKEF